MKSRIVILSLVVAVALLEDVFQGVGWFVYHVPVCRTWFVVWILWTCVLVGGILFAKYRHKKRQHANGC
jgi:hypothetical protein